MKKLIKEKEKKAEKLKGPANLCTEPKPKLISLKIFTIHPDYLVYFLKLSLHNNKVVHLELPVYDCKEEKNNNNNNS